MIEERSRLFVVWGALTLVVAAALPGSARAQHTDGCPISAADYGVELERTFTDSMGRSTKVFFQLPPGYKPEVPTGILMYFHGNDLDPDNSYVAPLYELQDRADAHGLIAAGLKSIGTRTNQDGTVSREWVNTDARLLSDLLLSDFGGCIKLDRTRVFLEGASQGTCFLSAALSDWLWRDFAGGVIGLCGCWGYGEYDYPVNEPALRARFKVFVENTTEDFLHDQGVIGLDIYKYNFGLDVRADLDRAGTHCADSRVNATAALDWMIDGKSYPDPDANQPHWQMVDTKHNGLESVAYDAVGKRYVLAVERADVSDDVIEQNEHVRWSMFADSPQGYLDWRLAMFPEYKVPPVLVLVTSDYGATFKKIARSESTGGNDLEDLVVAPDGSILVSMGALGVRKVNEAAGTIDTFAFDSKLVYGLDHDDSGNVFAHGAVIHVQRSHDSGATWTELSAPVLNQNARWVVGHGGGTLAVIGSDGQVRSSQDAGDHFQAAALPTGMLIDFGVYGMTFYAVMSDNTLTISQNAGTSWQPATVPSGQVLSLEVLPNGDALINMSSGITYRSTNAGQSWVRERGAHNTDARMTFAVGPNDQAMMVTTRGTFRFSKGPLLDLGTPPPPLGSMSDAGSSAAGKGGSSGGTVDAGLAGAGRSGGSAGAGASGALPGGTAGSQAGAGAPASSDAGSSAGSATKDGSHGGCGCRIGPSARPSPRLAVLAALAMLLRTQSRRRRV